MHEAKHTGTPLLIEATCNQVNQFGGYTGMKPADFREFVYAIADRVGLRARARVAGRRSSRPERLAERAGRDRDGTAPTSWSAQYVAAGFRKIHLDCSMACADDPDAAARSADRRARRAAGAGGRSGLEEGGW